MYGSHITWFVATVIGSVMAQPLGHPAQSPNSSQAERAVSCLDTVSMTGAMRHIVYIQAAVRDSIDPRLGQQADVFTQSVAQHLRHLSSPLGDTLPEGEPAVGWRRINPAVVLTVVVARNSTAAASLLRAVVSRIPHGNAVHRPNGSRNSPIRS